MAVRRLSDRERKIRRTNTKVTTFGWNAYIVKLVIDHQSFQIGEPMEKDRAHWYARQLAIALARFKNIGV